MKIRFASEQVRTDRKKEWHNWFAWRPIRINPQELVWLETVQRKGFLIDRPFEKPFWKWFYKPL